MNEPEAEQVDQKQLNEMMEVANLLRQVKSGASNYYWIAALSFINSLVTVFGGGFYFVIGLGVTLFIDAMAASLAEELGGSTLVLAIGLVAGLMFDLIFVVFGYFAAKGHRWAFITGLVLYGLDAVLMLAFQEWIGFAFHVYFMFGIWKGLSALNRYRALTPQTSADSAFPQDIGMN